VERVKEAKWFVSAVGLRDKVSKSLQLQQIYGISDQLHGLANIVNETFLSPMRSLTPLPSDYWCNSAEGLIDDPDIIVSVDSVQKKLSKLILSLEIIKGTRTRWYSRMAAERKCRRTC
jgi:hypothetical protein